MELYNDSNETLTFEGDGIRFTVAPGQSVPISNVRTIRLIDPKPKRKKAQAKPAGPSVNERLADLIMRVIEVDESQVVPSANLVYDLDADSLGLITFFMELEEEFGLTIHDDEVDKMLDNIGQIEEFLHNRRVL